MLFESPSIRVERQDQIATLWLDVPDRSANLFTRELIEEFEQALLAVRQAPCLDLLVLRSAKAAGFSPGFMLPDSSAEHALFAAKGQHLTRLLETVGPDLLTVAVIEGDCRSSGLELALACDYRVLLAKPDTVLDFPECSLGLTPCWGATQRLPRLIGRKRALSMLIQGEAARGRQAVEWGLVDAAWSETSFRIELQAFIDRLQDAPRRLATPRSLRNRWHDRVPPLRWLSLRQAARQLADVDKQERPAPTAILNAIKRGYRSLADGLAAERTAFAELAATDACRIAFERERLTNAAPRLFPEPINPILPLPERIGIVGGGDLGAALVCDLALRGRQLILQELNDESLEQANRRIARHFREAIADGHFTTAEAELASKNIRRTTAWNGFEDAEFVIEAVDDDSGIKRGIFHELEQRVRPRVILASASSTIVIDALQAELQRPGRVAGLHFLNGVNPLVEVVRGAATETGTLATLDSWLRVLGRKPIIVGDRPGRLVRRVQLAYWSEAVLLMAEGLPPELVDREMRRFGMAEGPFEEMDRFGFDALAQLVEDLQHARGDVFARNLLLERMRVYGWNGRDSGEGFYRYRHGRARPNSLARMIMWHDVEDDVIGYYVYDPEQALRDGVERLVLRGINEAAACLADEHDGAPDLVDLALVCGMNWAPHRGGPLRYADELGVGSVADRLTEFTERYGKRFEPCLELQRRAEAGESFHGTAVIRVPTPVPELRMAS